mgnify:CR=1 FL=1
MEIKKRPRTQTETMIFDSLGDSGKRLQIIKDRIAYVENYLIEMPLPEEKGIYLMIVHDKKPNAWYQIQKTKVLIGRAEEADIIIEDINISRIHCYIEENNGIWIMKDNGSKNGVFINGEKTMSRNLCEGDVLRVGKTEIIFIRNEGEDFISQ